MFCFVREHIGGEPEIINIKPVRVQFTSPNYLGRTLGQGKRVKIHEFWRNSARVTSAKRFLVRFRNSVVILLFIFPLVLTGIW